MRSLSNSQLETQSGLSTPILIEKADDGRTDIVFYMLYIGAKSLSAIPIPH